MCVEFHVFRPALCNGILLKHRYNNFDLFVCSGATAVLVLQDGRQRNCHAIKVVFRDVLGTEMKMCRVATAQVE